LSPSLYFLHFLFPNLHVFQNATSYKFLAALIIKNASLPSLLSALASSWTWFKAQCFGPDLERPACVWTWQPKGWFQSAQSPPPTTTVFLWGARNVRHQSKTLEHDSQFSQQLACD